MNFVTLFFKILLRALYICAIPIIFILAFKYRWKIRDVWLRKFSNRKHLIKSVFFNKEGAMTQLLQTVKNQDHFNFSGERYEVQHNAIWKDFFLGKIFSDKSSALSYICYLDNNPLPITRSAMMSIFSNKMKWTATTFYKKMEEKFTQDLLTADQSIKQLKMFLMVSMFLNIMIIIILAFPYIKQVQGG